MTSEVQFGKVLLKSISELEINESIDDISNTAKITIPHNYAQLAGKFILDQFQAGSPVVLKLGYNGELNTEFTGYVREIDGNYPVIVYCDDESYVLRQSSHVGSFANATLREVLNSIIPKNIKIDCPDVNLGKFQIDKESAYQVLQRIKTSYGMYSRVKDGVLYVNLRELAIDQKQVKHIHKYVVGVKDQRAGFVKKNELKYKRKEDYKLTVRVTGVHGKGKKTTVEVGSKDKDASKFNVEYPGNHTEDELRKFAQQLYLKRCYDGYTGTITGFGAPRTHAGEYLEIKDIEEPNRNGVYFIEKVDISYNLSDGFSRKNTLSYKVNDR